MARWKKIFFWWTLGTLAVVFLLCGGGVGLVYLYNRPEPITWDLRHKNVEDAYRWPKGIGDCYERKGRFDLTIIDSHGKVIFRNEVHHFYVVRRGARLESTFVHYGFRQSAEESYRQARKIMDEWHFRPECIDALEEWHGALSRKESMVTFVLRAEQARKEDRHNRTFRFYNNYPNFNVVHAGNVELRITVVNKNPPEEDGLDSKCISMLCF